jgi:SAM-dependent methyltransferase
VGRHLGLHRVGGERALDIGGFDGYWASHLNVPTFVVDVSPLPAFERVRYVAGDALSLPFADSAFEVVYGFDVIEHVPDERVLITEARRVLRPGGQLILTTPDADTRITPAFLQPWVDRKWGHDRVRGFEPGYLHHILSEADLNDVRVRSLSIATFRRRYLALSALWRTWPSLGRRSVMAAARRDAKNPEGPHGWLVARAVK